MYRRGTWIWNGSLTLVETPTGKASCTYCLKGLGAGDGVEVVRGIGEKLVMESKS